MAKHPTLEELGEPALRVDGFQLWVHGYQFPELTDYWDGNWLRVTAHCGAAGASVWVSGALIRNGDLIGWADQCDSLRQGEAKVAELAPLEPEIKVTVRPSDELGHFTVRVEITPEHMTQRHSFEFGTDQTYLPEISRMCRGIARTYPLRGEERRRGV
jgi:hypothetical protein